MSTWLNYRPQNQQNRVGLPLQLGKVNCEAPVYWHFAGAKGLIAVPNPWAFRESMRNNAAEDIFKSWKSVAFDVLSDLLRQTADDEATSIPSRYFLPLRPQLEENAQVEMEETVADILGNDLATQWVEKKYQRCNFDSYFDTKAFTHNGLPTGLKLQSNRIPFNAPVLIYKYDGNGIPLNRLLAEKNIDRSTRMKWFLEITNTLWGLAREEGLVRLEPVCQQGELFLTEEGWNFCSKIWFDSLENQPNYLPISMRFLGSAGQLFLTSHDRSCMYFRQLEEQPLMCGNFRDLGDFIGELRYRIENERWDIPRRIRCGVFIDWNNLENVLGLGRRVNWRKALSFSGLGYQLAKLWGGNPDLYGFLRVEFPVGTRFAGISELERGSAYQKELEAAGVQMFARQGATMVDTQRHDPSLFEPLKNAINKLDAAIIITGDRDFIPLISEYKNQKKPLILIRSQAGASKLMGKLSGFKSMDANEMLQEYIFA